MAPVSPATASDHSPLAADPDCLARPGPGCDQRGRTGLAPLPGAAAAAQNTRLGGIRCREGDGVAGRVLQAVETPRENPCLFDASASGGRFYAYVGNDPLNLTDPSSNMALVDNLIGAGFGITVDFAAQYARAYLSSRAFHDDPAEGATSGTLGLAQLPAPQCQHHDDRRDPRSADALAGQQRGAAGRA